MNRPIFVFGSNLAGIHGAGAARTAWYDYGAERGNGVGRQGHSYAIPTKDGDICTLPLADISLFVNSFVYYAEANSHLEFLITRIGCGLAGYKDDEIAPVFLGAPNNCIMPIQWQSYLASDYKWHNEGRIL